MNNYKEFEWPEFSNKIREIFQEHVLLQSTVVYKNSVNMVQLNHTTTELNKLQQKFDFLSNNLLIFTQAPSSSSIIHVDNKPGVTGRIFAFNIAISGIENKSAITEFFEPKIKDQYSVTTGDTDSSFGTVVFEEVDCNKIDEYFLYDNPILINTQIPHRVNNMHKSLTRISFSWTIDPELSWEQAIERIEYHKKHTQIN